MTLVKRSSFTPVLGEVTETTFDPTADVTGAIRSLKQGEACQYTHVFNQSDSRRMALTWFSVRLLYKDLLNNPETRESIQQWKLLP